MSDLYVSWDDYHRKIEQLAVTVYDSGWQFNQIVCLAKGGLRIGDAFARLYDLPLAILSASSYGGTGNRERGTLVFSRELSFTTLNLGDRVLLVDDLADSGLTLKRGIEWLKTYHGFYIDEIRTAVLWYKACSIHKPDYYVDYLADSPWIHQPFEPYEETTVAELSARLKSETAIAKS